MTGLIQGIARRTARREPMEIIPHGEITTNAGLVGDFKGAKHKTRQITILALEDWRSALNALSLASEGVPWTTRRANLLSSGLRLPRVKGAIIRIGTIELEVTGQTYPCHRMDEAYSGLLKALAPNWRGGVTCKVLASGLVAVGDPISILSSPPEPPPRRLPG